MKDIREDGFKDIVHLGYQYFHAGTGGHCSDGGWELSYHIYRRKIKNLIRESIYRNYIDGEIVMHNVLNLEPYGVEGVEIIYDDCLGLDN